MSGEIIVADLHDSRLWLHVFEKHGVVLSSHHEGDCNKADEATKLAVVNKDEESSDTESHTDSLGNLGEEFFVGEALIDTVLRIWEEHMSPCVQQWHVELIPLQVYVVPKEHQAHGQQRSS